MPQYAVERRPFLRYDGTNSADILDLIQWPYEPPYEILGEAEGVLTLGGGYDQVERVVNLTDYVIAAGAGGGLAFIFDTAAFSANWLTIEPAP